MGDRSRRSCLPRKNSLESELLIAAKPETVVARHRLGHWNQVQKHAAWYTSPMSWARADTAYLVPINDPGCPWQAEYLAAVNNSVALIVLSAFDHLAIYSWKLPLPVNGRSSIIHLTGVWADHLHLECARESPMSAASPFKGQIRCAHNFARVSGTSPAPPR